MRLVSKRNEAQQGQIIIFVAVVAVAMLGMIGMAVDLGYAFVEKRSVQNAADAAAAAGTRIVTQWSTTNNLITAQPDVAKIVAANNMGDATQTFSCFYVDDKGNQLDSCGKTVPEAATGVTVSVSETHQTFFIRVIPGAPKTVTTSASATTHAETVTPDGSAAPFIVCGSAAEPVAGGNPIPIVNLVDGKYVLNQAAIGTTFEVHGKINDCGLDSNRYKGLALGSANQGKKIGDWFYGDEGEHTGPARMSVRGIQGCNPTTEDPFGCVLFLPLATDNPKPQKVGSSSLFNVVGYAAFNISECSGGCKHQATLIGKYIIDTPEGTPEWQSGTWKRGDNGIIAIRLTK